MTRPAADAEARAAATAEAARRRPVPLWRWILWSACLAPALVLFYVVLTPLWIGLRLAAWAAELRARARNRAPTLAVRRGEP